jgi:hypothetical protein
LRKRQEKRKHVAQYSRRPVKRETTKSNSISESVFKGTDVVYDDIDDLFAEPEKLQEILCFTCFSLYPQERFQNNWR